MSGTPPPGSPKGVDSSKMQLDPVGQVQNTQSGEVKDSDPSRQSIESVPTAQQDIELPKTEATYQVRECMSQLAITRKLKSELLAGATSTHHSKPVVAAPQASPVLLLGQTIARATNHAVTSRKISQNPEVVDLSSLVNHFKDRDTSSRRRFVDYLARPELSHQSAMAQKDATIREKDELLMNNLSKFSEDTFVNGLVTALEQRDSEIKALNGMIEQLRQQVDAMGRELKEKTEENRYLREKFE